MGSEVNTTVIQWVLDTRPLWPSAQKTKDLTTVAASALNLLTDVEQANVLRYYHVRDAKLALGSVLLKRYAIARFCDVSWADASPVRDERTKPVFRTADGREPLLFNVSHQAGLVVFIALHNPPPGAQVGVDVVCPAERRDRDRDTLAAQGWAHFVDVHADVFSDGDVAALKRIVAGSTDEGRDRALRYFYALWCLREAYVKMTGEALLAAWLGQLEMPGFAPPEDKTTPQEVWLNGQKLDDVNLDLKPLLDDYMVSTAVRAQGEEIKLGDFTGLDIEEAVAYGENAMMSQ
ncbi:hypothetical protein B0T10DRAFT_238742 [Thelonectria olida]|uniref:holo-[acyl-carrier-protein] synthase n=1 Tax=Thelonectria olida TaxID=1576542 RepID=A0A9P8WA95_9HYPO|nr:hypothetical protein B0T10DRAFT_238742 [Thelonectria olida]